jgi:hypothetical protein
MRSAIHICVGDRVAENAVNEWLHSGGARVAELGDVYSAGAHLIRHRDDPPAVCVVGANWLRPDELIILAYIRRTWPRTPLVVYGLPVGEQLPRDAGRAVVCRSPVELQALLSEPLESLLSAAPARDELEDEEEPETPRRNGERRPVAGEPADVTGVYVARSVAASAPPRELVAAAATQCEIDDPLLTREELAALLGEDD